MRFARQGHRAPQRGLALSLRGYLDNGESTQAGAALWACTAGPTGNEAIALQNDGVLREDFEVSDAFSPS